MEKKIIITIGRQYGSGGRFIAQKLAEILNIPCYDKNLLEEVAKTSDLASNIVAENDEKPNSFMYAIFANATNYGLPVNQQVFLAQFETIRKLAAQGSCIFVGRCADYVLEDLNNVVNIFIHAPLEKRIKRVYEFYNVEENKATDVIRKMDKKRSDYYNFYTNKKWGRVDSYHLAIDSSIGIDKAVEVIRKYIESIE